MIREKVFIAGDLIKYLGRFAIVLEKQPMATISGDYWYKVHLAHSNRIRVIHQVDMEWP
jgi:hypothetical protein